MIKLISTLVNLNFFLNPLLVGDSTLLVVIIEIVGVVVVAIVSIYDRFWALLLIYILTF